MMGEELDRDIEMEKVQALFLKAKNEKVTNLRLPSGILEGDI
jgi:hypothetical protein